MPSKHSLLSLPPEIRIKVYKHLSLMHSYTRDSSGLRRTCRTIRSEYTYEALKSIKHSYERLETKLAAYNISILSTPESILSTYILSVELPQFYLSNPFRTIPADLIPWKWLCLKCVVVQIDADHPYVHAGLPVMHYLLERFDETIKRRTPSTVHKYHRMHPDNQFAIEDILVHWCNSSFKSPPPSNPVSAWYDKLQLRLQRHARLWDVNLVFDRKTDRDVALRWRRRGLVEANCALACYTVLVMLPVVIVATGAWLSYCKCRNELVALAKMWLLLIRFIIELVLEFLFG